MARETTDSAPDRAHPTRQASVTSSFGVSKRENHDATAFYERFEAPIIDDSSDVVPSPVLDEIRVGDARDLSFLLDRSVALVVTSPPYFAGKEYELESSGHGVPGSYLEYLEMLRDVFAECRRVLEPGGRIAVNTANLGRRPYRSLSADIITILQDDLGLLMRGELVWVKGKGANGSCAWGSYASASNPVIRDVTERVAVASKGRFDRSPSRKERERLGLPFEDTITAEDFRAWTLDTWHIAPESARRIGHPAPFPVELPRRLIELNTFRGDLVLDPFMGAGQTAIACKATGRHYVGVDLDPGYVALAVERTDGAPGSTGFGSVRQAPKRIDVEEAMKPGRSAIA